MSVTRGFYITLNEAKDRQKQIESQLEKQPNLQIEKWVVKKKDEKYTTDSHNKCLEEAIRRGWDRVLILEDDAILPENNIHDGINAVNDFLDGKWHLLIMGHKTKSLRTGDVTPLGAIKAADGAEGDLFRVHRSVAGCHAYVVNGLENMAEVIRIMSVSEYTTNALPGYDTWFKGFHPNKSKGRHCIEGSYLREKDLWFIASLTYVTEKHINGYSYRMKNTKDARWDDESAKNWARRLKSDHRPQSSKHVLVIEYPGCLGKEIAEVCRETMKTTKIVNATVEVNTLKETSDIITLITDWAKTKRGLGINKKHVIFAVTANPDFVLLENNKVKQTKKWSEKIKQITKEKYDYDFQFERVNNDRNRHKGLKQPSSRVSDILFTTLHVEDFVTNARNLSTFLSMRLALDARHLEEVGDMVAPKAMALLDDVYTEESEMESEAQNFKDHLTNSRFIK
tara:strand:- start:32 stop:1390 length:1359 start_codon:yes stop_codon:yes gene_type:complete